MQTITQNNLQGWGFFDDNGNGGSGSFVSGPGTPPLGNGSAQLALTASNQGYALGYGGYGGTALSSITNLSYSTYVQQGNNTVAPALQLNIDPDLTAGNTGWHGRLVYEPYYTHTVTDGTWQTWNTQDNATSGGHGNWWFSNGTLASSTGCSQAAPCTWSKVLSALPHAGINASDPGLDFKAGSNWAVPFKGNVDNFTINDTTYNFDLAPPAQVTGMNVTQGTKEIGCGGYVNQRTITVSWNASTDAYFSHYVYQADADQQAPYDYTTTVATNSRTGDIRDQDGTYYYRVAAVNTAGVQGAWSDWCGVTLDRVAPTVVITNPLEGEHVSGNVDIRGSVNDANPDHYYLEIDNSNNQAIYGHVYYDSSSFTNQSIHNWNTGVVPNGNYTIKLAARDKAGNRGPDSEDSVSVLVNNAPTSKDQCKDGGWKNFYPPEFNFKNQGLCMSWVEHNVLGHGTPASNKPDHSH